MENNKNGHPFNENVKSSEIANLDEIVSSYDLDELQKVELFSKVYNATIHGKTSSNKPFAVIVLGQPGAGKSGVMAYSFNQFPNVVELDIDKFRPFHPRFFDVSGNNPEAYEQVTGKFATEMILDLTPELISSKYNLILHKTRGDDAIIEDTIKPLKDAGYDVILRIIAVHELESKISALNRSVEQYLRRGFCKWVETKYHNTHYKGIVDLSENLVKNKFVDAVEVYVRGAIPSMPKLVYSNIVNNQILTNEQMITSSGEFALESYNPNGFKDIRNAIEKSRESQLPSILENLDQRVSAISKQNIDRVPEFVEEINKRKEIYCNMIQKN